MRVMQQRRAEDVYRTQINGKLSVECVRNLHDGIPLLVPIYGCKTSIFISSGDGQPTYYCRISEHRINKGCGCEKGEAE